MKKKNIIIEVDVSATLNRGGPGIFIKGLHDILPYKTKKCNFIPSRNIYPIKSKKKTNFYYIPFPHISEQMFNKWINIRKVNKLLVLCLVNGDFFQIKKFGKKEIL